MRKRREYSSRSLRPASEHRRILHGSARPMLAGSDSIEVAADVAQWRPVEGHAASVRFELDHRVIRDRDPILDQVSATFERSLEHRRKPRQIAARYFDHRMVSLSELEFWFHDRLKGQHAESFVEVRDLPELPARDIRAFLTIAREQLLAPGLVREVLHDRVRLPQLERSVNQRRHHRVRIERNEIRRAQLTREKIVVLNLYIDAEMIDDSFDLAAVRRANECMQFHCD